jgi:hypothetical protein
MKQEELFVEIISLFERYIESNKLNEDHEGPFSVWNRKDFNKYRFECFEEMQLCADWVSRKYGTGCKK